MEKDTSKKNKRKFKVIYLLIIIPVFLAVAYGGLQLWDYMQPYPGNDRNVEVIKINETYEKNDLTFTITKMELGDNFAVVYFEVEPAKMTLLDGLQLYNDGEELGQRGAGSGSDGMGHMAFDVPEEIGKLEIRIYTIEDIDTITTYYPLEFKNNKTQVEIEFDGHMEVFEIKLLKDTNRTSFANILNYPIKGMYNDIHSHFRFRLVKDGISTTDGKMCKTYVPDELRFDYYDITYSDDVVIIPIT